MNSVNSPMEPTTSSNVNAIEPTATDGKIDEERVADADAGTGLS